jgi:hypothetical protein
MGQSAFELIADRVDNLGLPITVHVCKDLLVIGWKFVEGEGEGVASLGEGLVEERQYLEGYSGAWVGDGHGGRVEVKGEDCLNEEEVYDVRGDTAEEGYGVLVATEWMFLCSEEVLRAGWVGEEGRVHAERYAFGFHETDFFGVVLEGGWICEFQRELLDGIVLETEAVA